MEIKSDHGALLAQLTQRFSESSATPFDPGLSRCGIKLLGRNRFARLCAKFLSESALVLGCGASNPVLSHVIFLDKGMVNA
jgi:hypothetical protein